jgi:alcohol dehydrogenase (NADP+)
LKVGDRVGVGAQSGSCSRLDCDQRVSGKENLCQNDWIGTYDGIYPDGSKSYDGSSKYCRAAARFVVKIPAGLSSAEAASTMCAGVTTYRDITENGAGPGKRVVYS